MTDQFDNVITDEESRAKLLKIISRRIINYSIDTLVDTTAIVATPFIIKELIDNVTEEYAKTAISATGSVLFLYELNRGITNVKMTKFLLGKRNDILMKDLK